MAKASKKSKHFLKFLKANLSTLLLFITLIILIIFVYQVASKDKFFIFSFIGDTSVTLLNPSEAKRAFEVNFNQRVKTQLTFITPQQTFTLDLATSSAQIDYSSVYDNFNIQHSGSFWEKLQKEFIGLILQNHIYPKIIFSDDQINEIGKQVLKPAQNAQINFDETPNNSSSSANIQIKEGLNGISLDKDGLKNSVSSYLLTGKYNKNLPLKTEYPKVSNDQVQKAKEALEALLKQPLHLTFEDQTWAIDAKQALTLLNLTDSNSLLDKKNIENYIKSLSGEIDQNVTEGLFEFNSETKRVSAFRPSQEGRKLDREKTYSLISEALEKGLSDPIILPINVVKPKVQTKDVNSLGIKELLGRGISNFAGSIPNRIYNVSLTAEKINGTLVPPGEVFSFNQTVGDISSATGFKQAYVIKEGRTVLDDGGGVCQDSTTLFRAVLNAGLPVLKRVAHAYRVGYYEQGFPPGLDATVFYPSVDFQFKNDTNHYILIQAYSSGLTLYVDLYGTSDNRISNLTTPIISNRTPAPPDLRQDDPTLPKGVIKQVDFAASGADVSFKRIVIRNGETIINETWKSNYRPWQAIYLVGTQ